MVLKYYHFREGRFDYGSRSSELRVTLMGERRAGGSDPNAVTDICGL
jgi:hypothetical protein